MLKVKENIEMIKEIRKYITSSLKSHNVTSAHADLAKIVLMYDYEESVYDNPDNEDKMLMDCDNTD